jgi:hypothetical protein
VHTHTQQTKIPAFPGNILNAGDLVLGYDLSMLNLSEVDDSKQLRNRALPEVIVGTFTPRIITSLRQCAMPSHLSCHSFITVAKHCPYIASNLLQYCINTASTP